MSLTKRQQEIIWSAVHLIDENGIQGLTIKNLSARIGFTEAAIYRHFKSKGEILSAIINIFREQVSKIIVDKNSTLSNLF